MTTEDTTSPELLKRKHQPALVPCGKCKTQHPEGLLRPRANGKRWCIFCVNAEEEVAEERRLKEEKKKTAMATSIAQRKASDRDIERARNDLRQQRAKIVKKKREEAASVKQEIDPADQRRVAAEELAKRELCRRHLLPFVQRFNDRYDAGWVHKDICQRLEQFSLDVAEGKSPRLMLFMPPRHGKSELASRAFPAWHLGRYPEHEFIACSYASDLAQDFSRKVREVIRTPEYGKLFEGTRLSKDTQRVDKWATTDDGGYTAAGVGGPITGRGAHVFVIDDPVKNREEADSESVRRTIKNWYTSTAYTRLAPGGGMLIILTRWHDDDLAGWLTTQAEKGEGDQWEVIEYPAVATKDERYRRKGEALHAARYPLEALKRIKRAIGDRDWSALYQQRPVADDGDYFHREMFPRYAGNELPAYGDMAYYTAWDLAIGKAEANDETFGVTVGVDRKKRLWVVDVRHGRWDAVEIVNQILETYVTWRADVTGIEKGQIEMAIGPYLEEEIRKRRLSSMYIEGLKPGRRDKQSRARPIQALMQRKQVFFRGGCDETQYLINQMLRFPSGVHDDGVDAMAWIGQMIQGMTPLNEVRAKPKKSWRDDLSKFARAGARLGKGPMSS